MFGGAAKTPFGGGSTFGTGTTAFGTQATASPFGQTSATGTTGGGLFGGTNTQGTGFGTFGQTQQGGTGLFGSSTNTSTGTSLFGGGTSTGSLFGQPAATKGFGTSGTSGSIFGGNTASTGSSLFGQSSTFNAGATNTFGGAGKLFGTPSTSTATTGLFGAGATQQSSLFSGTSGFQNTGFGSQATAQAGTPLKFTVVNGSDQMVKNGITTTVNTRHQSITVMKEYEGKSFEELRFEDYSLGRKTGASATGGLFSGTTATTTSATTGGLFGGGSTNFSAFAQPKTGFGTTGTSLFGQPTQTSTGGLFGSKPGGLFGTNTPSTATTGFGGTAFGTPASGSIFGQSASTGQTGGLFGTTTTTQSGGLFGAGTTGFGQTAALSTGLFGQTSAQQTGLFNNKLGTGTAFGASTSGGLFGANNKTASTGFGGLGSSTGFGSGTNNTSLFGKSPFGATGTIGTGFGTTTGTGLFGATTGLGTTSLTGGFGQTGFGTSTLGQPGATLNLGGNNTLLGNQNNALLASQQQVQMHQQILALNNSPFGDSKLFRNSLREKSKSEKAVTSTTTSSKLLGSPSHYKVSSKLTAKIKPRPINNHTMNKLKLFEGLDDEVGLSPDTFVPRKSIKKLVIRNRNGLEQDSPLTSGGLKLQPSDDEQESEIRSSASPYHSSPPKPLSFSNGAPQTPTASAKMNDSNCDSASPMGVRFSREGGKRLDSTIDDLNVRHRPFEVTDREADDVVDGDVDDGLRLEPCGIILTRPEYYTKPSITELNELIDENGEIWVIDFVVGREGYGEVKFLGNTNVADLNLDDIVFFRRREIEVYPDSYVNKPPVGQELNKKSEITLIKVWPNDKTTHKPIKTPERLKLQGWLEKVEAATAKLDACFIDYRPQTGTWVFTVEHFTKYGIHEFLDDENAIKKLKIPPKNTDTLEIKESQEAIDQEKLAMVQKLKEQQAKLEAYELEKERAAESMQEQDSDIDEMDNQVFPGEELVDEEEMNESPASHQLATALGVSAHRMQVMKASFFGESEPSVPSPQPKDRLSTVKSLLSGSFDERGQRSSHPLGPMLSPKVHKHSDIVGQTTHPPSALFGSPKMGLLSHKHSIHQAVVSDAPQAKIMLPSAIGSAFDRGTKLVGARAKQRSLVPKDRSITNGKEGNLADFGLVMGRSFRVGWGPGFVLVHSGQPLGKKNENTSALVQSSHTGDTLFSKSRLVSEAQEGYSPFGVVIERLNIAEHLRHDNESALLQHVSSLEVELEHSKSSVSKDDGCPFFEPSSDTKALHHHAKVARKNAETFASGPLQESAKHASLVWDLAVALWGQLSEDGEDNDDKIIGDRDSYRYNLARREAVSRWLFNAAKDKVKTEVDRANFEENDYLGAIWSHVTGRQISQACHVAQQHRDHRLALLISQATGNWTVRCLLQKQLSDWEQTKADGYITEQRIKILALLAGVMVWRTSNKTINACEGLDWKRALAVHMWYQTTPTTTITDVLACYEDSFKGRNSYGHYGACPNPPYREDDEENEEQGCVRDTCYHLLKLYCKRSHRLERAIAPATYTPYQLDYRQSWHLSQALESLGYTNLSSYHAGTLHSSFAAQLEALGLWEWAAFVVLHMKNKLKREHAVRSLLCRHIQLSTTEDYLKKERFLKEKLLIPAEWIHEAKAIRANYLEDPHEEAIHLLKSRQWNRGHQVILTRLASDAIINEEFDTLQLLLSEMEPRERSSTVKNWTIAGQVLLDFLKVTEKFKALAEGTLEPTKYNFEEIHMQVSSLCTRINYLPSMTAKDRLCQYELGKKCFNYLKMVTSELGDQSLEDETPLPSHVIVPHLSKLPLPEDCTLAELRDLTASYVSEITANI